MKHVAQSLPIASIGELEPEDYVGLIDDDAVACLSVRLAIEGLQTSIWVRHNGDEAAMPWSVIAGRHRLRAAIQLGWTEISAEQRADENSAPADLRRLQIVENLDRRDLRPIERALFVMERWSEAAQRVIPTAPKNQQSQAIRARWSVWDACSQTSLNDRRLIDEATAADCGGKTDRWVRTYRRLYETIIFPFPELSARLNAHSLGKSQSAMNRLATVPDKQRQRAIETVLSNPDWKTIDEALAAAKIGASRGFRVDQDRPDAVLLDAWSKAPRKAQRAHVEWLADKMSPGLAGDVVARFKKRGLL